ncbi:hypothetical protein SAMN05421595_1157 [Austwickia chelonae]|nr:hypothetical protein SAMN05421595_1157 [Austwickia chelonae]
MNTRTPITTATRRPMTTNPHTAPHAGLTRQFRSMGGSVSRRS